MVPGARIPLTVAYLRIFFVNRYFYPDHAATSQMLTDLAFALAKRGHRITVVTSRLRYDDPLARLPEQETVGGVDVIRIATSGFGRAGLFGRAVDYLTFYFSAARALFQKARRGDVIVAKTDPPLLSLVTMPVARLRGARAVNWLQDIYPDVATVLGVGRGRLRGIPLTFLRWWRNRALPKAALNVAIGERMATMLRGIGVPPGRIRVIPNWADGTLVRPVRADENALRRQWRFGDDVVIGYSGNLGRAHDAETILQAMDLTEARAASQLVMAQIANGGALAPVAAPRISWLFVGGGAQFERLRAESRRRGHLNVQFQPYQPREQLAESLSTPDIHLISLRPGLEGLIVPSKYYGIAAAGRPAIFIGASEGEIGRILTETGTGLVVAEGDGAGLADAVRKLVEDPRLREEMGRRARALFEARFDLSFAVDAWDDVIRSLRS